MKNSRCDHRASWPMNKPAYWGRCLVGMLGMLCLAVQPGLTWGAEAPYLTLFRPGNIPVALDLHGSAVVGKRLYVFGGKKANVWNKEAWSGEIQPNTTITDWRVEESLPEFRTHISDLTQVVENRIYIVGGLVVADEVVGNTNIHTSKEVLWTRVKPDGHLEPWQRSPGISESPTFNGAAVATDQGLYLFGGRVKGTVSDVARFSPFGPDGTPGEWRDAGKLPVPLSYHGAAYMEGRIYLWGGQKTFAQDSMNDLVYATSLGRDGSVGAWSTEAIAPLPVFRAGFLGFNDYIVSVGGLTGDKNAKSTNETWFTRLGRDGKLGPWQVVKSDLESRMYHSVAIDKDRNAAFVVGGRVATADVKGSGKNVITTIQAFALPAPLEKTIDVMGSGATATASANGLPKFTRMTDAIKTGKSKQAPVLVFFYSPQVPACRRVWETLINTTAFAQSTKNCILAAVDSTGADSQKCYDYNVFRVPSLVLVKPDGSFKHTNLKTEQDIQGLLSGG